MLLLSTDPLPHTLIYMLTHTHTHTLTSRLTNRQKPHTVRGNACVHHQCLRALGARQQGVGEEGREGGRGNRGEECALCRGSQSYRGTIPPLHPPTPPQEPAPCLAVLAQARGLLAEHWVDATDTDCMYGRTHTTQPRHTTQAH